MKRHAILASCLLVVAAHAGTTRAAGSEPSPAATPTPPPGQPVLVTPTPPPVDPTPKRALIPAGPARGGALAAGEAMRALSLREGEGRLMVGGRERTLRPGGVLGKDVVKSISPGRMVLNRPAAAGRPAALVVVDFDEAGRGRTRVYYGPEAAPTPLPEVR